MAGLIARKLAGLFGKRGYAAAEISRVTSGARASAGDANAEISIAGSTMRNRARQLMRDNGYGRRAVSALVTGVVGYGIAAQASEQAGKRARAAIAKAWAKFEKQCDYDQRGPLAALLSTAVRSMIVDGDALIVRMATRDGVKLRLLEIDHLDTLKRETQLQGGGFIVEGVEYDAAGQRAAYWLFPEHPGGLTNLQRATWRSKRWPASDVIHLFERQRPGQNKGATWLSAAVLDLFQLGQYQNAELIRKHVESCFAAFITQPELPTVANITGKQLRTGGALDGSGNLVEQVEPGMIHYLAPGSEVKFAEPSTNAGMSEHEKSILRKIAVGLDVPYEAISGDLSDVNYSSYRGARLAFKARIEEIQWLTVIPVAMQGIWDWFIADAVVKGVIRDQSIGDDPSFTPPRFEATDPYKDTQAIVLQLRNGLMTWPQAVAALGYDPETQAQEAAAWFQRFDELGLIFDCDPRKRQSAGAPIANPVDASPVDASSADAAATDAAASDQSVNQPA